MIQTHNSFTLTSSNIDINNSKAKFGDTIITSLGRFVFSKTGLPFQGESYAVSLNSVDATVASMSPNFAVSITDDESNIISLTLDTHHTRIKGEDVLQKLIDVYIQRNLNEKNKISDIKLAFIKDRVAIVSADLNNVEFQHSGLYAKNKLADIEEQSKALVSNASEYYNKLTI